MKKITMSKIRVLMSMANQDNLMMIPRCYIDGIIIEPNDGLDDRLSAEPVDLTEVVEEMVERELMTTAILIDVSMAKKEPWVCIYQTPKQREQVLNIYGQDICPEPNFEIAVFRDGRIILE